MKIVERMRVKKRAFTYHETIKRVENENERNKLCYNQMSLIDFKFSSV